MCKLCRFPPHGKRDHGFLQTLVAYHSLEPSDVPPPDPPPSDHNAEDIRGTGVIGWSDHGDKLATNEKPVSPQTLPTEEVYTNETPALSPLSPVTVFAEAGTITDVCNHANLPEVEILSLIEEQIPKYRLRADTITDFRGYDNADWIQTPLISLDTDLELTDEQIEETLKYFILCSERLTQMTKTFNDIEAVNRLLEEKERDLELAARIGQTLLEKNKQLCEKNAELDESLGQACDKVQQLRHDISMKDELLRFYCQDLENAETESSDGSPSKSFNLSSADLDALQKRVLSLEEDNLGLRLETVQLKSNTDNMEEKEQKLVADCVIQLNVCNEQLEALSDELIKKAEENTRQKEEITALLAQIVDLQKKSKTQTIENMELSKHLEAAQYSQRSLTRELTELHDRYDELFELLEEAQDELKLLRSRDKPRAVRSHYMSTPYLPTDSLASELQASLKDELDFQKGASALEKRMQNWKVFETAKAAKRAVQRRATSRSSLQLPSSNVNRSGGDSVGESGNSSVRSSFYMSDNESAISDGYNADMDSLQGSDIGRPGVPGSNDLETALRKLAMRRANELNEKDFFEDQLKRDRSSSTESCNMRLESDGASCLTPPMPSWTPDSLMSVGSLSGLSGLSMSTTSTGYRLPEKLQIVKPIEGSVTLRRWQMLATPHMGGIFEERPGVVTKGQEKMEEETYNLSDLEEDDEHASCPSKRFEDSGSVYTYTNSVAARHGENLETTPSLSSRMSSIPGSSKPNFPRKIDNKQGQFTMSLGLAAILNEREHNSAPDQGIGLRINTAVTKTAAGKQPEMTDSNYESMTTSATNSSILLQEPPMRKQTQREAAKTPPQRLGMKEGESARSFIERLKSKSRSLYSIWNSSSGPQEKVTDLNVSSSVDGPTMTNSVSDSAVSSAVSGTTVTAKSTSTEKKNSDPLKGSPSMGVLGALTNFRTSGLL